jgi:hypothetical protein
MDDTSRGDTVQSKLLSDKNDSKKKARRPPTNEDPNDPASKLMSYCPNCYAYFNFQETIAHAKSNPNHKLISVVEMKVMLKRKLEEAIEQLQKREVKVEQATIEQKNDVREKMEGLRARGLQQIGVMKERVIEIVNTFFQNLEEQWHDMFESFSAVQKNKNVILKSLQEYLREFITMRDTFSKKYENDGNSTFSDLYTITTRVEGHPEVLSELDERISRLGDDIKRVTQINLTPKLTFNEKLAENISEALSCFAHVTMTSEVDNAEKYGYSNLRITPPDFYQGDTLRKNMNANLAAVCNISNNKFLPVIAKNRKLLMYEITTSSLKEFPINEVFHIPLQNQLLMSELDKGTVYISGGHLYKQACDKFFEFQYKQSKFTQLPAMLQARWMHRMAQHKNSVFVVGGVTTTKEVPITSCEKFDVKLNEWKEIAPLNVARHSHGLVVHHKEHKGQEPPIIFAFGGVGAKKNYVDVIEEYNIVQNTWRIVNLKNPMVSPVAAGMFCSSINPQQILIFGGFKHLTFERGEKDDATGQAKPALAGPESKGKASNLYDYPYGNFKIWVYNVAEESTRLLDSHQLSYGVFNEGNPIIADQKSLFCIGKFNEKVLHIPTNQLLFSEGDNQKMAALKIDSNNFSLNDFILLS